MKKHIGVTLIILLCTVPILLWLTTNSQPFSLRNVSQVAALIGATLFSINFILSGRFRSLETIFGGLNRIYIVHHLIGQIALIALLIHPTLLAFFYIKISLTAAFTILFPPIAEYATWFGLAALTLLIILLVLTLYIKLPYQIWKLTHKFMGLALTLAVLHVFFIQSDVATNMPLRYYMLSICTLGLISYCYRVLLYRFLVKRSKYIVSSILVEENVNKITLKPESLGINDFFPGQFIFISFDSLGITSETHPFSLTSSPSENEISIAAKSSGDYTETLKLLRVGSRARVEGPFGRFSYLESHRKKQIWIAGGIGITPFISMAKNFTANNGYDAILYYTVSEEKETVFAELLKNIDSNLPNFKVNVVATKSLGRLTANQVSEQMKDLKDRDIFLCGPPPMMKSLRSQFNDLGIRNSHIFSEEFSMD